MHAKYGKILWINETLFNVIVMKMEQKLLLQCPLPVENFQVKKETACYGQKYIN